MGHKHSREQILEGALDCARADGLSRLSFGRVAAHLGISDRVVVYYFPTKDELLGATVLSMGLQLQATLAAAITVPVADHHELLRASWPVLSDPDADAVLGLFFEANGLAAAGVEPYRTLVPQTGGRLDRLGVWVHHGRRCRAAAPRGRDRGRRVGRAPAPPPRARSRAGRARRPPPRHRLTSGAPPGRRRILGVDGSVGDPSGMADRPLLDGVRVIESSLLGPGQIATFLSDLGADVIKVEPPAGDYIRRMTWPIVNDVSLLHLHTHRGKRSITLNLKSDEGVELYKELVAGADAVVEAMRPGSLAKLGLGYEDLKAVNPKIVFCTISGYGATGPYRDMPSHGIAYDTWAGLIPPEVDDDGFCRIPEMPNIGINVGPMLGAFGLLAGIIQARATGEGCAMEVAQSDAAAYMDWYRIETWKAYERPEDEVTGNAADDYERRAPGLAGMREGVRYQIYESSDGHVLFMASERAFWKNFCEGVGRTELFEKWPGAEYADHARGNLELQAELRDIFRTKTSEEWLAFSIAENTPIAPVNDAQSVPTDPQFQERFPMYAVEDVGAEQLPLPLFVDGSPPPTPSHAPTVGQHTDEVLGELLDLDDARIAELRDQGAFG